ncbi:type I-E CRISPR-associated protein Cse1/CasA [Nicoliella lavandulae]|uniref:Type I-E CRISPR-associated protein Cse1/CasA n=1 Tax=Nicoliella lavandulae TaxID=3082954 RepID=A0ABU8SMH2_9LACO
MGRYNLLDESWIKVIDENYDLKSVSLKDLFANANHYKLLAGDTAPQNFAVFRFLLSVIHTVFSRYDADGNEIDDDDDPIDVWKGIWENERFPKEVINKYLESQRIKFNLYDEDYPFFQVTKSNLEKYNIKKTGTISGKLINRLLSESDNKQDLFAPTSQLYKNKLSNDELVRWLITFQGYTGTGDKAKFPGMKVSASRGWLLDLGGVYIQGNNLFQTLMFNFKMDEISDQTPIWEWDVKDKMNLSRVSHPENLADLYTNCSRLIFIDPNTDLSSDNVSIEAVQLPGIIESECLMEPMTIWQIPKTGKNKGNIIPKNHRENEALWRSFGSLIVSDKLRPGIIDWFSNYLDFDVVNGSDVKIVSVGMTRNHDASSMPNDEIHDGLKIKDELLHGMRTEGWIGAIESEVKTTKDAIYSIRKFGINVCKIRNDFDSNLPDNLEMEAYFDVDIPFKEWVEDITLETDLRLYPFEWRKKLYEILKNIAKSQISPLSNRDLIGVVNSKDGSIDNIVTEYMKLLGNLKYKLDLKED